MFLWRNEKAGFKNCHQILLLNNPYIPAAISFRGIDTLVFAILLKRDLLFKERICSQRGGSALLQEFEMSSLHDTQCTKKAYMQFADNAGPDQPVHLRRLIWALIVRLQSEYCSLCGQTKNVQIRLHGCVHLSGPLLFACGTRAFFPHCTSHVVVHIVVIILTYLP